MNSIFISGYKSFKAVELKLNPIIILIDANGSGKSYYLSFFEMLHCIYEKRLTEYVALNGGTERFFHKGLKVTDMIKATIAFQENTQILAGIKEQQTFPKRETETILQHQRVGRFLVLDLAVFENLRRNTIAFRLYRQGGQNER